MEAATAPSGASCVSSGPRWFMTPKSASRPVPGCRLRWIGLTFCVGQTSSGAAILAPEWVDLCRLLDVVPKACRPYRAKTKGKVERMVRELKESFLPWLSGQLLPALPSLADYDALARTWVERVVLRRRHRTTHRIVADAWREERALLRTIPARILAGRGCPQIVTLPTVVGPPQGELCEVVEVRDLREYERAVQ